MTYTDIQNQIIEILLKNNLTLGEMSKILFETDKAIQTIIIPQTVKFKNRDGEITDTPAVSRV